jgi:4-amino-4-deoxy-L-arabinose transferase-like glycosyltransferase
MADSLHEKCSLSKRGLPGRMVRIILLTAVLGLALWLRITNLDAYTGSFDEGIRSQQMLLMSAGFRPFRDIFASQGPLLLDLLYPFYRLFGESLAAVRSGVVACSAVALLGAWWTARLGAGRVAGLAAAAILAVSPSFLEGSRLALAEVPTIAPSLLALVCLLAYRRAGDRRLLVLSAVCCAVAVLIKPMVLHVGAPIAVLLLWPSGGTARGIGGRWQWRAVVADLLLYGAVVGASCVAGIALLGPAQVWDNLGAYRGGAGHTFGADARTNLRLTVNIMRVEQPGLFVLAAAGLVLGLWQRPMLTLALTAWGAAVLALFAGYGDLADKHIVYLTPVVALLASVGAGLCLTGVSRLIRREGSRRLASITAVVGGLGVVAYLWTLPAVYAADRYVLREAPKVAAERRGRAADVEIAEIIRTRTPPDGWVLADNPNAAFTARRRVIPYLVDTSGTRIDAGSLTSELAIQSVRQYRPSVIVTWPLRLAKLTDFVRALPELGYHLEQSYPLGWKVYVRRE